MLVRQLKPIEMSSPERGRQAIVAGETPLRRLEVRAERHVRVFGCLALRAANIRCRHDGDQQKREQRGAARSEHHRRYHPSLRPPSAKSQSR